MSDQHTDSTGWIYMTDVPEGDCRKLVSLQQDGMEWVGIRAWIRRDEKWYNGNDPETAHVVAWMDLPATARRYWSNGVLVPEPEECRRVRIDAMQEEIRALETKT